MKADIVIVGGGVHGAGLAYHLAKAGSGRIVLLEKNSLASGPTGKSGTMIRPLFVVPAYLRWVLEATVLFENWENEIGGSAGFVQDGFLRITKSLEPEDLGGDLGLMKTMGAAFEILTPAEILKLVPELNVQSDEIGVFLPTGGYADPLSTTVSLARAAERMGVQIWEGTKLLRIDVDGSQIRGVETTRGRIDTEIVINCGGTWSKQIASMVNISLPIEVHRQPTCLFNHPVGYRLRGPIISDSVNRIYVRELGDSVLRSAHFGWTNDPADPDDYQENIAAEEVPRSRKLLNTRSETFARAQSFGGFSGLYDMTPDGHPIISDFAEVKGFWSNCGWSGNGFASAPAVGRYIAKLVRNEIIDMDMSMFRWPRPEGIARMNYGAAEGPDR